MIQPLYKKGNWLAWIGYFIAVAFDILQFLGNASYKNASNPAFVPSLAPFVGLFALVVFVGVALMFWGCVLALKAKHRSLWWLLFFLLVLSGGGIIFVVIIFMLKDKSAAVIAPSASDTVKNTPTSPQ